MFRDKKRYGQDATRVVRSKTTFNAPLSWATPRKVFTCSWSDFFIAEADEWRDDAWDIIKRTPQHTYQILTKRPERIAQHLPSGWPFPHVWLGVSVEHQDYLIPRWDYLRLIPAAVRFISYEPMLSPLDITTGEQHPLKRAVVWTRGEMSMANDVGIGFTNSLHWLIAGCESGPTRRQSAFAWARSIRDQCRESGVAFFMKQLEVNGKVTEDISRFPEDLRIREYPEVVHA